MDDEGLFEWEMAVEDSVPENWEVLVKKLIGKEEGDFVFLKLVSASRLDKTDRSVLDSSFSSVIIRLSLDNF